MGRDYTIKDVSTSLLERCEGPYPPDDFVSNGATRAPDTVGAVDLRAAALLHDYHYHLGGDAKARMRADRKLWRNCRACDLPRRIAFCYWWATRVFGARYFTWKTKPEGILSMFKNAVTALIGFCLLFMCTTAQADIRVLSFSMDNCQPCAVQEASWQSQEVTKEVQKTKIKRYKINSSQQPKACREWRVRRFPETVLIECEGGKCKRIIARTTGALAPAALVRFLRRR